MLRFRRTSFNGVQHLLFIHGFRQLALYSTSISTEVNPNFVNYFVEKLGFSMQEAVSTSSKFIRQRQGAENISDNEFVTKSDSVIEFLTTIGLQQHHIRNAISIYPRLLMCNVEKTLTPKSEILQKLGFSGNDIAEIARYNPTLVFTGLSSNIAPCIQSLRDIMGYNDVRMVSVLKKLRCHHLTVISKHLVPNVALFRSYGIPIESIRKILQRKPAPFTRETDFLLATAAKVEQKLGIPRSAPRFLIGVDVFATVKEEIIESKLKTFKSFGWEADEIAALVSSYPFVLGLSEDGIKKKLDFLMNEMGYKPSFLSSKCNLFTCSLEKRLVPRHKVLLALKENDLMSGYSLPTVVCYSDLNFLKKFVLPFKEVHEVYSKHAGISLKVLTQELSKPNSKAVSY